MGRLEITPWDGTDYGEGWEQLAVAYFKAAGQAVPVEHYAPLDHGVPTQFHNACEENHEHFVEAILAWLDQCDTDLYPGISTDEAPWIVEWASDHYLGRYSSILQFAEFEVANELPDSDWGITWDDYVDFDRVADALQVMDVDSSDGALYLFDNRDQGPALYRKDWLTMHPPPVVVGESVDVFMYSLDGVDPHLKSGIVRGKWRVGPGYEWMVAVEVVATGDVVVRETTQLYRLPVEGRPRKKPYPSEIEGLPEVRLAHRRVVEPEEGTHGS